MLTFLKGALPMQWQKIQKHETCYLLALNLAAMQHLMAEHTAKTI